MTGEPYSFDFLRKFGLKMQAGLGITAPMTEAMYYLTRTESYKDGDTTPFTVPGPGGEDLGFVGFTKEFKCTGSILNSSLTSDADVDKRIRSAVAAFGALRFPRPRGDPRGKVIRSSC